MDCNYKALKAIQWPVILVYLQFQTENCEPPHVNHELIDSHHVFCSQPCGITSHCYTCHAILICMGELGSTIVGGDTSVFLARLEPTNYEVKTTSIILQQLHNTRVTTAVADRHTLTETIIPLETARSLPRNHTRLLQNTKSTQTCFVPY